MNRKIRVCIVFTLLFVSMFTLAISIQPVNGGTIVVPVDFPTIQAAIDSAVDNDTIYVLPGIYNESIQIPYGRRGIRLEGRSSAQLGKPILNGSLSADFCPDTVVANFEILGMLHFGYHWGVDGIQICNNTVNSGAFFRSVYCSIVEDNVVYGGLYLYSGRHAPTVDNFFRNNTLYGDGIYLDSGFATNCVA